MSSRKRSETDNRLKWLRSSASRRRRKSLGVETLEGRTLLSAGLITGGPWHPTSTDVSDVRNGPMANEGQQLISVYLALVASSGDASKLPQQFPLLRFHGSSVDVGVSGNGSGNFASFEATLGSLGMEITGSSANYALVDGYLPIGQLPIVAGLPQTMSAHPIQTPHYSVGPLPTFQGSAYNQALTALRADTGRQLYNVDGKGVTVGVISDSVSQVGNGLADSVGTGDLPKGVRIIQDGPAGSSDEGRAMLENIYDIAPGASLSFATADGGDLAFANNILALADQQANIIVDDVGYSDEPFFQDGLISQAINSVTGRGVTYFSAAGNTDNQGYLSDFRLVSGVTVPGLKNGNYMNFNPGAGKPVTALPVTIGDGSNGAPISANNPAELAFQFDQPFTTQETGTFRPQVTSEVDFYVLDSTGKIVASGTSNNTATQEPIQFATVTAAGSYTVVMQLVSGPAPGHVEFQNLNENTDLVVSAQFGSDGGTFYPTTYGHSAAQNTIGVGTAPWWATGPYLNQNPLASESFSSYGPTEIVRDPSGRPLAKPQIILNPTISAVDGGNTSFFGDPIDTHNPPFPGEPATPINLSQPLPSFFGTSSAAPNAAAVAALMLQLAPNSTPADIRSALILSASGMNGTQTGTWDQEAGYGMINAQSALNAISSIQVTVNAPVGLQVGQVLPGSNVIATFTDALPDVGGSLSNYTATINWGDGQITNNATIAATAVLNQYNVLGGHQYTNIGTYQVIVTIEDQDTPVAGTTGTGKASVVVNFAPLSGTPGPAISTVEGTLFTATVATFTDPNPLDTLSSFTASIDWGDGNVTFGIISAPSAPGNPFVVKGSNTYAEFGTYTVTVTIAETGGAPPIVLTLVATVADAPLVNPTGVLVSSTEGFPFNGAVANFTDENSLAKASDFTAVIVWGNGSTTAGTVVALGNGQFEVDGTTIYLDEGQYPINVSIADDGGQKTSVSTTATVADAPITATVGNVAALEGQSVTITANFSDANVFAPQTDYSVTIDFGDNSSIVLGPAALTALGNASYIVSTTHTYEDESGNQPYIITVTVNDAGGSVGVATASAIISDAPLTADATPPITVPEGQTLNNVVLATFVDGFVNAPISDFTATIDWGDGFTQTFASTPPVQIVSQGGGHFSVLGTHAYAEAGTYPIAVAIVDEGGSTAAVATSATATEVPLTAGAPSSFVAVEGTPFGGVVGTFTDANPLSNPKDFFASIVWGDGTESNSIITQPNGPGTPYTVSSSGEGHSYARVTAPGQPYQISIKIYDIQGATVDLTGTAVVNDAPITVSPVPAITGLVEGSAFTGVFASFVDAFADAPQSDYSATIVWGDGFFSQGTISFNSVKNAYDVSGTHSFTHQGSYNITVTVNDVGGSTSNATTTAAVADAPLANATASKISAVAGSAFIGQIAQFEDQNPFSPTSEFTATIKWGDGKTSLGTIVQPGGLGTTFIVNATHTYAKAGASVPISITIKDVGGSTISTSTSAHVLVPLSGTLSVANNGGTTNVTQPKFTGGGEPGSIVKVFATSKNGTGSTTLIGKVTTDANGHWSITSPHLVDGRYKFKAQMIDATTGVVVQQVPLVATAKQQALLIDTTGPVVKSVSLNPSTGQLHITLFENLSGLNAAGLANKANYQLGFATQTGVQLLPLTQLSVVPGAPGSGLVNITATFSLGSKVRAGTYVVTLKAGGLADNAGNILAEHNFVTFPQIKNVPNPNYVAAITVSSGLTASGPQIFVPYSEQVAANRFAKKVQAPKIRKHK